MQKIFNELRLESGLLTRSEDVGIKIESNAGIRFNKINTNVLGERACCFGRSGIASGYYSTHFGRYGNASGDYSAHFGRYGVMFRYGQIGVSAGRFSVSGDCQRSTVLMRGATTDATPLVLTTPEDFFIEDEKAYALDVDIMARQDTGASHLFVKRQVMIERTGGVTALVGAVQTVGTDINVGSLGGVAITADDTNDRLQIEVTGKAAANIRWSADITIREIGYAD